MDYHKSALPQLAVMECYSKINWDSVEIIGNTENTRKMYMYESIMMYNSVLEDTFINWAEDTKKRNNNNQDIEKLCKIEKKIERHERKKMNWMEIA